MGALHRVTLLTGLALVLNSASTVSVHARDGQKESQPGPSTSSVASPATKESFAGVWVYNPEESLNSANGRKEDNAAMRRGVSSGNGGNGGANGGGAGAGRTGSGGTTAGTSGTGNPNPGGFGGGGGGGGGMSSPFTSLVVNERRDLVRDLLEVPVELKIKLTDSEVTFVDHLDREITYPTTGKKKKYQLSASVFEAKAYWDGSLLKKEIEGTEGFRMSETYMLSESGKRLFVIVRVGNTQDKQANIVGVNRVYDRVER
jgi:hypothetical protein